MLTEDCRRLKKIALSYDWVWKNFFCQKKAWHLGSFTLTAILAGIQSALHELSNMHSLRSIFLLFFCFSQSIRKWAIGFIVILVSIYRVLLVRNSFWRRAATFSAQNVFHPVNFVIRNFTSFFLIFFLFQVRKLNAWFAISNAMFSK